MSLSKRVVSSFLSRIARIVLVEEQNGTLEVSGKYNEMQAVMPRLKSLGFRWDPSKKVWYGSTSKLTALKRKNLDKLIAEANGEDPASNTQPVDPEEERRQKEEQENKRKEHAAKIQEALRKHGGKWPLQGVYVQQFEGAFQFAGDTFPIKEQIKKLFPFAKYGNNSWVIYSEHATERAVEEMFSYLDRREAAHKEHELKIKSVLDRNKEGWPSLGVKADSNYVGGFVIGGNTYPYKDTIRGHFSDAKFQSSGWYVPYVSVSEQEVGRFISIMDKKESEKAAESPSVSVGPRKKKNQKGGECRTCGAYVAPEEGYLWENFSWEEGSDEPRWYVTHQDKKVCDAVIEEARIRANEAHTRNQARQNLRNLAAKPEHYVGGTGHQPQGEEIALDDGHLRIYGGGEWVVIEPGGQHFWYVRNNGADGDDWSHNNVTTGGAGAIGYRLPMTEEARVLLDVATGKTKLKVAKTAYNYDRSNR
jgi:hypothetical protein